MNPKELTRNDTSKVDLADVELNRLQNELDSIRCLVDQSNPSLQTSVQASEETEQAIGVQEEESEELGEEVSEEESQIEPVPPSLQKVESSLTTSVWPHPKLFLNIIRKMYKQGLINFEQKGELKERILAGDQGLEEILVEYEKTGEREALYTRIQALLS